MKKISSRKDSVSKLSCEERSAGKGTAFDELLPGIHEALHQIAAREMAREREDHTLQATALMNEAYLRLADSPVSWADRGHFLAVASNTMRRILVDHARARVREKRGGDAIMVTLHEAALPGRVPAPDILDVEAALKRLEQIDERKARIVEMCFFGGMTRTEIAEALELSDATVDRELRFSKAWLRKELAGGTGQ